MYEVKIDPKKPDKRAIAFAAAALKNSGLVAFPTETVYGIAVNLDDRKALKRLYKLKGRPAGRKLTVHIADKKTIRKMGCALTSRARKLADKFWPGPLTIILRSAGGDTAGFRMPANAVALALIRECDFPVGAPSANPSGKKSPHSAGQIDTRLKERLDVIMDAGESEIGIESTIVDFSVSPPRILREGAIKSKAIYRVIK